MNRANRTAKAGFRSGIMNIDNPEMEDTVFYKEEQRKIREKRVNSEQRQKIRTSCKAGVLIKRV